ncbi:MAG: hypothetical protein K8U03_21435 [Planctomycetia bacterium]|nr:hypothetical protein [Planctomycetia bacterium]
MASVNRAAVLTKLHKVLKKHYQSVDPPSGRTLLENLLFACCLENAPFGPAEAAFQAVSTAYFDWNEVRVSTVKELAEVMKALPNAEAGANNLRRALQAVFEANYSFDLEPMKKLNLGQAVQKLSSYDGVSPFVVNYVTQTSLGGHAVPLDTGAMGALAVFALVGEADKPKAGCAGMERAIPKNKGIEFGSLLHQLSADYNANPYSTNLHKILLEVDPEAKARLPKRPSKNDKKPEPEPTPPPKSAAKPDGKAEAKPAAKPEGKAKGGDGKAKPADAEKKAAPAAPAAKKASAPAAPAAKKAAPAPAPAKKPAEKTPEKKPAAKAPAGLGKRKPR